MYGQHEDKAYYYSIGICVSPDPETNVNCAVFQKEEENRTTQHCLGTLSNSQVSMSKSKGERVASVRHSCSSRVLMF